MISENCHNDENNIDYNKFREEEILKSRKAIQSKNYIELIFLGIDLVYDEKNAYVTIGRMDEDNPGFGLATVLKIDKDLFVESIMSAYEKLEKKEGNNDTGN